MHVVADAGGALTIFQSGALQFFCTQAVGIMFEDGIQEIYRILFGDRETRLCKAIGFIWVIAFISWSSPVWVYPIARTMEREDMLLTIYAVRPLLEWFWR